MPIVWNDTLATGLRQIDLQHQELIALINALEAACDTGHTHEALTEALPQLNAYVLFHFGTEEMLFKQAPSEHAERHRRQHAEFTDRVSAMQSVAHQAVDLPALINYLKRWLIEHIMKTDRELARQILARLTPHKSVETLFSSRQD